MIIGENRAKVIENIKAAVKKRKNACQSRIRRSYPN